MLENLLLSNLGDRGEMGHSVEGRTPFLDHHLTEYVNGLPVNMKIRAVRQDGHGARDEGRNEDEIADAEKTRLIEKYVLREAVRPFVTEEIYTRPKHPYTAPVKYAANGPLHRLMKRLITRENISRVGFLDWTCDGLEVGKGRNLGDLVDAAFTGNGDQDRVYRLVLCVAQWVVLTERFGMGVEEDEVGVGDGDGDGDGGKEGDAGT